VPRAIDEFPALFVAAACARGRTVLTGASELRVKESDRIAAMAEGLTALGARAQPTEDGIVIDGGQLVGGAEVSSHGDHRVAMALAIAGLRTHRPVTVSDCAAVDTSFPRFAAMARAAGLQIREMTAA
jgi:3-phosphoshikimate 1-carboxyvinyltransferase